MVNLFEKKADWNAVFSLFMGVMCLISAEFIPVSLLTPIATDLNITEGMAGQSITTVGIFAVIASLSTAPLTKMIDRKTVLITLSALLVLSNLTVAVAPNFRVLLIGRALLGISVGGFWSMASSVTLQLVPSQLIPRALSIVYAGVSVATIVSLPLASYLGNLLNWRTVFIISTLLSLFSLAWQWVALPHIPAQKGNSFHNMLGLVKTRWVLLGMFAMILSYGGYHIFFSYLRPYLEYNLNLSANNLSITLLIFGIANCISTLVAGALLGQNFRLTMLAIPTAFLIVALLFLLTYNNELWNLLLIITWGLIFGFIPVGWTTWIAKTLVNKAEIAGGLSVACIQFAIGLAAAAGGLLFDKFNINGIFISAAFIMLGALLATFSCFSIFKKTTGITL